jgi:SAM-dependent methyltransferase
LSHYDERYFNWQKKMGEFVPSVDLFKFRDYVKSTDNVIDFGCGGGFMLKALNCKCKIGIEINSAARQFGSENGLDMVKDADEIEDQWADVIISDNALEHTLCPFSELKKLYPKLKPGGKIVFVVPHEKKMRWKPNDINQHLYTWSQLSAGNLFTQAGFNVEKINSIPLWPPFYEQIKRYFGLRIFFALGRISTALFWNWDQIRVVATKPFPA